MATMTKVDRIFSFAFLLFALLVVFWLNAPLRLSEDPVGLYIFTALLSMAFLSQIVEHYFTKPSDVLSASIAVLLLITPIHKNLDRFGVWFYALFFYSLGMGLVAVTALAMVDT